ncbi:hypothetical protein ZWY2020_004509 [Hordeum vulgare]|nr:hypothetical protein ZWY2020_004509 [Hordeum vulgare]
MAAMAEPALAVRARETGKGEAQAPATIGCIDLGLDSPPTIAHVPRPRAGSAAHHRRRCPPAQVVEGAAVSPLASRFRAARVRFERAVGATTVLTSEEIVATHVRGSDCTFAR